MATRIKSMEELYAERMARKKNSNPEQAEAPEEPQVQPDTPDTPAEDTAQEPEAPRSQKMVQLSEDEYNMLNSNITKLQNDLKSMEGRLGPTQRRSDSMEKIISAMEEKHRNEVSALEERIRAFEAENENMSQKNAVEEVLSSLSDEEKELFDEQQLNAFGKIVSKMIAKNNPRNSIESTVKTILDRKEEDRINNYRNDILENPDRETSVILQIASDPRFQDWAQNNYDVRIAVNNLLTAKTIRDIDESAKHLVKRIKNYREETNAAAKPTDVKTDAVTASLSNAMNRRSVTERGKPDEAEVKAKFAKLRDLSRSRSPADRAKAQALYSELNS